mgnify:CR=1 FL=1
MAAFHDLDDYLALPRVSGLAVSPDGSRLVTTVSALNDKRTEFVTAIWELDPAGQRPARRVGSDPGPGSGPSRNRDDSGDRVSKGSGSQSRLDPRL